MANSDIASYGFQNAADGKRRIRIRRQQNFGYHGGGSGFAVGARYGNGKLVVAHHLPEKLCTGQGRDRKLFHGCIFGIVRVDRTGIHHKVGTIRKVFRLLTVIDHGAFLFQVLGKRRFFGIRAGYGKAFLQKNFGKAAHADAPDSDKVYVTGMVEINLIHKNPFLVGYVPLPNTILLT